MNKSTVEKIEVGFWLIFVLLPMIFGWLVYQPLPGEYDEQKHELLESHAEECGPEGMLSCNVPDKWRDIETGMTYTPSFFAKHHHAEEVRISTTVFLYGLVGCLFHAVASAIHRREKEIEDAAKYQEEIDRHEIQVAFIRALKHSLIINVVVALFFFWMI